MRENTRHISIVLLVAAVAFAALLLACGSGDEEDDSLFATDTPAVTAPAATPTPTPLICPDASGTPPEVTMKQYPARPAISIDAAKKYTATVKTVRGDFTLELLPGIAPEHVNSFVFLAREGFYNGTLFHRVLPGFVAQGGDPAGTGMGGPGYNVPLEKSDEAFVRGVLGMARSPQSLDSAGSQWFVTLGDARHLDGTYTLFGKVATGMEVVDCIAQGDAMISVEISES